MLVAIAQGEKTIVDAFAKGVLIPPDIISSSVTLASASASSLCHILTAPLINITQARSTLSPSVFLLIVNDSTHVGRPQANTKRRNKNENHGALEFIDKRKGA